MAKTLEEKISVMQAALDGKEIEMYHKPVGKWVICNALIWDWNNFDYRVTPEPKLVPFSYEDAEQLIGKAVKHKEFDEIDLIVQVSKDKVVTDHDYHDFDWLLESFVFYPSLKPCGKLVEV